MTNADFEKIVDTSDEWITDRTGIKERRIADNGITGANMGVEAAKKALEMAGYSGDEIELIVFATVTPDYRLPSNACLMQEKMHLPNAVAFDIAAACTGFINGLTIAAAFIETGIYKSALVIGAEMLTSITNYKDRNTCVLFGDAAGAAVLTASNNGSGLVTSYMRSNGKYRTLLWQEVGGVVNPYTPDFKYDGRDKIYMNGSDVFKVAVREMCRAAEKVIEQAGLQSSDISLVVPHQANIRIIEALARRLDISMDKVYVNIENYGNTSAASVPLALDEANRAGLLKPGDNILMVAFGGGLIWGSTLVRW